MVSPKGPIAISVGCGRVLCRSASPCPKSSMVPTSLLRPRPLGAPEFSFWPNRSPVRPLRTWASGFQQRNGFFTTIFLGVKKNLDPPSKNHKQEAGSSLSHRLLLWAPPQVERGGCMQGSGLEKEPWAHLPLPGLLSLLSDARRTDVSEAPMKDLQGVDEGSRVAVSHQKNDIFNDECFPHARCVTLMSMCRHVLKLYIQVIRLSR